MTVFQAALQPIAVLLTFHMKPRVWLFFVYVIRQVAASLLSLPESIASENLGEVAHFYPSDGAHILLCLCILELPFLYCFVYGRLCGNSEKGLSSPAE
ncbi:hypothetical protein LNP05_07230 [Klebsiella pneumoniae subsp. pneumoniae]|nr:hypothetical protein [Klebsiella pneumoniae subsp. pneumoniae]